MAEIWGAAIAAAGVVGGAVIASNSASKASRAQQNAANSANAEQAREYDQTRADYEPWRIAGGDAVNRLNSASKGDLSAFHASPNYEFTRAEGTRGLGNSFAARGGAFSGNALRALDEFNQNLAAGQYGNWFGQQAQLAGLGVGATNGTTQAGIATTNAMNQNTLAAGNARASGVATQGNIWGNALNTLGSYGLYRYGGGYGGGYGSRNLLSGEGSN